MAINIDKLDINFIANGEAFDQEVLNRPVDELIDLLNQQFTDEGSKVDVTLLTGGGTLSANGFHLITDSGTYLLPDTTGLADGSAVRLIKYLSVTPLIQTFDGVVLIKNENDETDISVSFDINAEIIFVWNGTEWEI